MSVAQAVAEEIKQLPPRLRFAFSPLVKRAMGLAVGVTLGGAVFLVTIYAHFFLPLDVGGRLGLLSNFFHGYDVNVAGAFVGLFWGFWTGFVAGWFFAFCRNVALATWIFVIRTKAQLSANREFLDHI
jgi:hypothetical protein